MIFALLAMLDIPSMVDLDPGSTSCQDGQWFRDAMGNIYFCIQGVFRWIGR